MRVWSKIAGWVAGRRSKWLVLALALLLGGSLIALAGSAKVSNDPAAGLPASAESSRVTALQKKFPSGRTAPALVVYERADRPLDDADLKAITTQAGLLRETSGAPVPPPQISKDRKAATVVVVLPGGVENSVTSDQVAEIRGAVSKGLPAGVTAQVTGAAGFQADLSKVFRGANVTLLLTTLAVVALLLLITYRSPWLWLVPLAVVGLADQVTVKLIAIVSRHASLHVSNTTLGIVEVLVFGAGTNYALLLIARYREELRRGPDRHEAMYRALLNAGPAIIASGATVTLSLASLLLAALPSDKGIGLSGAIGIVVALTFGLLVLPAALLVFGRSLFWPMVPRVGQKDKQLTGVWHRIGTFVSRRPLPVIATCLALLAVLGTGLSGAQFGLSTTQQFRTQAESVEGLKTLSAHFPAGASDPTKVIARDTQADRVLTTARAVPGVSDAEITERAAGLVQISATLTASPGTKAAYRTIDSLRSAVHAVPGAQALVGGTVATNLDTKNTAARDQKVVMPVVLLIVLIILMVLLRALVGPVLLVLSVVASFFAALGGAHFAFTHWLGYPALDTSVPLLAFLFLVALGVDYNIFLISRGREEAIREGTRPGIITALAVTGGVITSAGILLAAVFTVLGVLPLIALTELGVIVGFGVLLDTLLVRTVLVPALVTLLGRRFWWPGRLSRHDGATPPEPGQTPGDADEAAVPEPVPDALRPVDGTTQTA